MEDNIKAAIETYVREKYPRTFKEGVPLIIDEGGFTYFISTNKTASPLIISKEAIKL